MTIALQYTQLAASGIAAANTLQSLYVVPSNNQVIGQVIVTNTANGARTFSVAIVAGGGSPDPKDYITYRVSLSSGEMCDIGGLTINETDQIWIEGDVISDTVVGTGITVQLYGELQVST